MSVDYIAVKFPFLRNKTKGIDFTKKRSTLLPPNDDSYSGGHFRHTETVPRMSNAVGLPNISHLKETINWCIERLFTQDTFDNSMLLEK